MPTLVSSPSTWVAARPDWRSSAALVVGLPDLSVAGLFIEPDSSISSSTWKASVRYCAHCTAGPSSLSVRSGTGVVCAIGYVRKPASVSIGLPIAARSRSARSACLVEVEIANG